MAYGDVIPDRIDGSPPGSAAVWHAADTAALVEALPPEVLAMLDQADGVRRRRTRKSVADSNDPCGGVSFAPLNSEHFLPNDTLKELAERSREVYVGQVVARRVGFFRGALVTMLAVHVSGLKQNRGSEESVLIPYPRATMVARGTTFCSRVFGSDLEPAVDDQVIVFSYEPELRGGATIVTANAELEMVIVGENHRHVPRALQNVIEPGAGFDRLRNTVSAAIERLSKRDKNHAN